MEEISEKEHKALVEFRKTVEDILPNDEYTRSDDYLIRWLRARDGNQGVAEQMLRNHFCWRKKNDIERVLELPPEPYITQHFPSILDGVALDGGPVLCISMRNWNLHGLVADNKLPQFAHFLNFLLESLAAKIQRFNQNRQPGEKATGFTTIFNWEGFSIFQMTSFKGIQAYLDGFSTYEAHYPELMAKTFFVNTNYVFQSLFVMLKPLLAPKTVSKIKVYGTNRSEWEAAVRAQVDGNQIAYEYGGVEVEVGRPMSDTEAAPKDNETR